MQGMSWGRRVHLVVLFCGLAAAAGLASHSPQVTPAAIDASVTVDGTTALAKFTIKVTNEERSPITNVTVIYDDGTAVAIGDVDAGKSAVSAPQERSIAIDAPSLNLRLPITVKFIQGTAEVEMPSALFFRVE